MAPQSPPPGFAPQRPAQMGVPRQFGSPPMRVERGPQRPPQFQQSPPQQVIRGQPQRRVQQQRSGGFGQQAQPRPRPVVRQQDARPFAGQGRPPGGGGFAGPQRLGPRDGPSGTAGGTAGGTPGIGRALPAARQQFQATGRPSAGGFGTGPRLTAQQVQRGRFAASFQQDRAERWAQPADRRARWLAARAAWRGNKTAAYVPWISALYWPYAYTDVFYYTFWPAAYEPGYWTYVYDDFFDGIFFPDGAPHIDYVYGGPYLETTVATGSPPRRPTQARATESRATPGRVEKTARSLCAEPAGGHHRLAVRRDREGRRSRPPSRARPLSALRKAAADAAQRFRDECPESVPLTPPGRLQAMTTRLQATLDAVRLVRPALEAFYASLIDEQRARFNAIGPDFARKAAPAVPGRGAGPGRLRWRQGRAGRLDRSSGSKPRWPPTEQQAVALERLGEATEKASARLAEACPDGVPLTPVGRLEAMEQRLVAMIEAAGIVRPALEEFYGALDNEQKAAFNRLNRRPAQTN